MGTFTNLVLQNVPQATSEIRTCVTGPISMVLQSVNQFKNYLYNTRSNFVNFVTGLCIDLESINDQVISETGKIKFDEPAYGNLNADVADAFIKSFKECSNNTDILVITDGDGRMFPLYMGKDANNKYIITGNYLHINGNVDYNILSCLKGIAKAKDVSFRNNDSILSLTTKIINKINPSYNTGTTILDQVKNLGLCLGVSQSVLNNKTIVQILDLCINSISNFIIREGTAGDDLLIYQGGSYKLNNIITATNGDVVCTWDVLSDLIVNDGINDVLMQYSELLTSGVTTNDAYVSLDSQFSNKSETIRTTSRQLRSAFATGGVYGLAKSILSYAKTASSIQDDDGRLAFTDNGSLLPKEYIAGMITTIVSTAIMLVSVIISIFSTILGAVVGIFGTVIFSLIQNIARDYSDTYGSLIDGSDVLANSTPFGFAQFEFAFDSLPQYVLDLLSIGYPAVLVEVPGGWLLIGYGEFDENQNPIKYRAEFHPCFTTCTAFYDRILSDLLTWNEVQSGVYEWIPIDNDVTYSKVIAVYDWWKNQSSITVLTNNDEGYLDAADDDKIRWNIFTNIVMFCLFLRVSYYADSPDTMINYLSNGIIATTDPYYYQNVFNRKWNYQQVGQDTVDIAMLALSAILAVTDSKISGSFNASWTELVSIAVKNSKIEFMMPDYQADSGPGIVANALSDSSIFMGGPYGTGASLSYAVKVPQYNRDSFFKWIALVSVITVVTAVTAIVTTLTIRRFLNRKYALANAQAYKAYENLTDNPTDDNYIAYRKAVRKTNFFARLTRNSTISKIGIWNSTESSADAIATSQDGVHSKVVNALADTTLQELGLVNQSTGIADVLDSINAVNKNITGQDL